MINTWKPVYWQWKTFYYDVQPSAPYLKLLRLRAAGSRTFSHSAPQLWNLQTFTKFTLPTFKSQLKAHLFPLGFFVSSCFVSFFSIKLFFSIFMNRFFCLVTCPFVSWNVQKKKKNQSIIFINITWFLMKILSICQCDQLKLDHG